MALPPVRIPNSEVQNWDEALLVFPDRVLYQDITMVIRGATEMCSVNIVFATCFFFQSGYKPAGFFAVVPLQLMRPCSTSPLPQPPHKNLKLCVCACVRVGVRACGGVSKWICKRNRVMCVFVSACHCVWQKQAKICCEGKWPWNTLPCEPPLCDFGELLPHFSQKRKKRHAREEVR